MNLQIIADLMAMMEKSTLSVLEITEDTFHIRMENGHTAGPALATPIQPTVPPPVPQVIAPVEEAPVANAVEVPPVIPGSQEIRSPMVGTFHVLADKPIEVGDSIKKGKPLCMIEAMKLMNEIAMEEDGEIVWIAVEEGSMVEYGQLLYLYK